MFTMHVEVHIFTHSRDLVHALIVQQYALSHYMYMKLNLSGTVCHRKFFARILKNEYWQIKMATSNRQN